MSDYALEILEGSLPEDLQDFIHQGHIKDEAQKGVVCHYQPFSFLIKDGDQNVIGALQAYTAYSEIYVDDIWVAPSHRGQNIGRQLLQSLEQNFKGKGYNNINLVTSHFQASEFYLKCGFEIEFVRKNHNNPKLSKTFFIKYFEDEQQTQGII